METDYTLVHVTKETVSDEYYIVRELFFENAAPAKKGDILLTIETSKTVIDIESPSDGYIHYLVKVDDEVEVGNVIAIIGNSPECHNIFAYEAKTSNMQMANDNANKLNVRTSKLAQKLIDENDIDVSVFGDLKLIEKKDVENYIRTSNIDFEYIFKNATELNNKLIFIGCGGLTKMCIDVLNQSKSYDIVGIVDSYAIKGSMLRDYMVLGGEEILEDLFNNNITNVVISFAGIGNQKNRNIIYEKLKKIGFNFPNIIHPKAIIEKSVEMGEGNIILAGAIVGTDAKIGNNCFINVGSILSHDTVLENNVHLAPGAILAGRVKVGSNTLIGMGTTIYYDVSIGEAVIINNGVDVFSDIKDNKHIKK